MEDKELEELLDDDDADGGHYVITAPALLYSVLEEYGIETGKWVPTLWQHIFDDFMKDMEEAGYVERRGGNDNEGNDKNREA